MSLSAVVRRAAKSSAPLTPAQALAGGLTDWFRADVGLALSGSSVTTWTDQAGTPHNLACGGSTKPQQVTNGRNGLAVVRFNGTTAYCQSSASYTINQPWAIWWCGAWQAGFASVSYALSNSSGLNFYRYSSTGVSISESGVGFTLSNCSPQSWHSYCIVGNGMNSAVYLDNVLQGSGNLSTNALTVLWLAASSGAGALAQVDIGEVIVASVVPSAQQMGQVHGWLSGRWGTP